MAKAAKKKEKPDRDAAVLAPIEPRVKDGPSALILRQMIATETLKRGREQRAHLMRITKGPLTTLTGKKKLKDQEQQLVERIMSATEVGMDGGDMLLEANAKVEVRRNTQKNERSARRIDAFDALQKFMEPGAYDAARQLEADIAERMGAVTGENHGRISGGGTQDLVTVRMVDAGRRVDAACMLLGARDARLLHELIHPTVIHSQTPVGWRVIVYLVTGRTRREVQADRVCAACAALAEVYASKAYRDILDRRPLLRDASVSEKQA